MGDEGSRSCSGTRGQRFESLPQVGWHADRRADLLQLQDRLERRIKPLNAAVQAGTELHGEARLLMTHPGVGPVISLTYVLVAGDRRRLPRGKQVASCPGLIPSEASSGKRQQQMGHITKRWEI